MTTTRTTQQDVLDCVGTEQLVAVFGGGARAVVDELLVDEEAQHVTVVVAAVVDGQDGPRLKRRIHAGPSLS